MDSKQDKNFFKKFQKNKIESELPFSYIIYRQIDRILESQTIQSSAFMSAVEALESPLIFYISENDEYEEELKKIESEYNKLVKNILKGKSEVTDPRDLDKLNIASYEKAKLKFRYLMKIIGKEGMLPGRSKNYVDEGLDIPGDVDNDPEDNIE